MKKELDFKSFAKIIIFVILAIIVIVNLNNINSKIEKIDNQIIQVITIDSVVISRFDTLGTKVNSLLEMVENDTYEVK